jgi:hypothetical protein
MPTPPNIGSQRVANCQVADRKYNTDQQQTSTPVSNAVLRIPLMSGGACRAFRSEPGSGEIGTVDKPEGCRELTVVVRVEGRVTVCVRRLCRGIGTPAFSKWPKSVTVPRFVRGVSLCCGNIAIERAQFGLSHYAVCIANRRSPPEAAAWFTYSSCPNTNSC